MPSIERCLIIDDDRTWQRLLAAYVELLAPNAVIAICNNLEQGLQCLSEEKWTIVLLDLGLPGCRLEPPDALLRLMDHFPHQPTVVVSGSKDVDETDIHLDLLRLGPCARGQLPREDPIDPEQTEPRPDGIE